MKKGLNIEVSNLQYQYLYDLVMFAYEMNLPNEKGWDLQTYDNNYRSDQFDTDTYDSMADKVFDAVNNLTLEDF